MQIREAISDVARKTSREGMRQTCVYSVGVRVGSIPTAEDAQHAVGRAETESVQLRHLPRQRGVEGVAQRFLLTDRKTLHSDEIGGAFIVREGVRGTQG